MIFSLNIDNENKINVKRKRNFNKIHNDSCLFFENNKNKFLLSDASFVDEIGYSMYYRIFNVYEFKSIEDYIKLYEEVLKEQKKGIYKKDFNGSYLLSCTSIQRKTKNENYFLIISLIKNNENYCVLFVEGDFDKCTVNILKKYILSSNQFQKWKKIISHSFEYELFKDFNENNDFESEEILHNEFNKFLENIKNQ